MRLFIAIYFNDKTRNRLLALREELRTRSKRGNFTTPENLHLTLAFLGECGINQISEIKDVMGDVRFEPFRIEITTIGRFKRTGGDIWWAGMNRSKELLDVQRSLSDKLTGMGFALDNRNYSPHITLGREVITGAPPWVIEPFGETVTGIELMKSERINGRLTYTAIFSKGADDN